MKIASSDTRQTCITAFLSLVFMVAGLPLLSAQNRPDNQWNDKPSNGSYYDRTKAVPLDQSRAQQEADKLVSLSADQVISLLADEPGLMLQCKKVLVRNAYEQGRLLDAEDLTDDAVFRLVREDDTVRNLFTREIESRYYVRAKPTRDELQQNWLAGLVPSTEASGGPPSGTSSSSVTLGGKPITNQEGLYWLRHEDDLLRTPSPALNQPNFGSPDMTSPNSIRDNRMPGYVSSPFTPSTGPLQQSQQQNVPQTSPGYDPRRSLLQAQSSGAFGDYYNSGDSAGLSAALGSDQASSLIAARMSSSGSSGIGSLMSGDQNSLFGKGPGTGNLNGGGMGLSSPFAGMSGLFGNSNSFPGLQGGSGQFPQQAALNTGTPSLNPPFYPPSMMDRQTPLRHRPNPYADVPSLYDLYQQYAHRSPDLDRFGIDVFQNGTGNFDELPMDMPVGPDYVLGPGDDLSIDLTGSVSQRLRRVVDREGRVVLPDVGGVQLSGKTLGDAQQMVEHILRTQYRDVQSDISLSRVRTVRVYVVGDVQRPGAYDVSSLSTPLNAVYEAGGPTSGGSLRTFKHYRGKQLVEQVDIYNLLLHGVPAGMQRLEAGDTVLVPPLGQQVTIEGMVRRPAIYELNGEKSLAEVLEMAGGVLPSGTLRHVDVERVEAHETRSMLRLDIPENNNAADVTKSLEDFQIQDGDRVQISPILPYAEKTVYLDGHVFRPGKFAYREGMKVSDLIPSYKDLLPEPYGKHAEIIRLKKPDNTPEVLAFNLEDALAGKDQNLVLQPFDTVRVYGRFDFEDAPVITVTGEVRDPGDHITNGAAYLRDAVYLAGGTAPDASLSDVQVFRKTDDGKLQVFSVDLRKALDGDPKDNILLASRDRIFIHRDLNKVDPPIVTIEGEVGRPGKYPLGGDMTAADLVRFAGGLKRSAYTEEADLASYMVENGSKVVSDHRTVQIAKALAGEPDTDVRLHDGDVLSIRRLSGWDDLGATITVKGEVAHPGGYGIQPGERLSSILARAGGFLPNAYAYGVVFERAQVRELQEKNRFNLIQRIQVEATEVKLLPGMDSDQQLQAKVAVLQYRHTIENLQNTPSAGRLVVHISSDLKRWANTPADIQVRDGDTVYVPKKPNLVLVDGSVFNPTAITYKSGKSVGWYLEQAGGSTELGDKKGIFVIRADGSVVGGAGGLFSGGVQSAELRPGDMVVVPEKVYGFSTKFKTVLQAGQLAASVGVAAYYAVRF